MRGDLRRGSSMDRFRPTSFTYTEMASPASTIWRRPRRRRPLRQDAWSSTDSNGGVEGRPHQRKEAALFERSVAFSCKRNQRPPTTSPRRESYLMKKGFRRSKLGGSAAIVRFVSSTNSFSEKRACSLAKVGTLRGAYLGTHTSNSFVYRRSRLLVFFNYSPQRTGRFLYQKIGTISVFLFKTYNL